MKKYYTNMKMGNYESIARTRLGEGYYEGGFSNLDYQSAEQYCRIGNTLDDGFIDAIACITLVTPGTGLIAGVSEQAKCIELSKHGYRIKPRTICNRLLGTQGCVKRFTHIVVRDTYNNNNLVRIPVSELDKSRYD